MSLLLALELLLLLLALPRLTCASNSTHPSLYRQAKALLQWKSSLKGWSSELDSWTKGTNPCDWTGVGCSNAVLPRGDAVLVVDNISLPSCHIQGRSDNLHFADLPYFVYLDLNFDFLMGPILSSIGVLPELAYLNLSSNGLNGSIPTSLVLQCFLPCLVECEFDETSLCRLASSCLSGPP
uniref:Leucine-rich repeat-containing N-terminal plant-type domain-containing protein n=1 Tax=Aegilops tauschii TaxID=37682 RepID=M8CV88_AEGTA